MAVTGDFGALLREQVVDGVRQLPRRLRDGDRRLQRCVNIDDLRALAAKKVPRAAFDYVDGAAWDEVTSRRNREDFDELVLCPRVLRDVSQIELSTSVLGQQVAVPVLGAPTGLTGLTHERGEAAVARAVQAAGSLYVLSALSSYSIEEVAEAAPGPRWFQLYMWRDRGLVQELVTRAETAGYQALMLTVDVPVFGRRERDARNGFGVPPRLTLRSAVDGLRKPRWSASFVRRPRIKLANVAERGPEYASARTLTGYVAEQFDPTVSWRDLEWIREIWDGPLVVKGVLHPADARRAAAAGASAIAVSNHAGRQLDHAPSAIAALPAVVEEVGGEVEVYMDGGIRRGTDVLKALALGARACLVGRSLVYGLGAGGEAGAARAMEILTGEIQVALALLGCESVGQLDTSWVSGRAQPAAGLARAVAPTTP